MSIPSINAGEPILAAWLDLHTRAINELQGFGADGAPGAGRRHGAGGLDLRVGSVVARNIPDSDPRPLHEIEYDIHIPGLGVAKAGWERRVVEVAPEFVGPSADEHALFWPAPVAGSAEAVAAPWRAYALVVVLPAIDDGGAPRWFAKALGESVYLGCTPPELPPPE